VPTHGDWQPRNWLIHDGTVRAIDLGRADRRPAFTDFARLAVRQFAADPALEAAFLDGYGPDPRTPDRWRILLIREAIGTADWAYKVGDERFEMEGHRMIEAVLV
jgi:thiamine kinase-like enzyme